MGRSFRASKEGVENANQAFQLKGCSQDYLAGAVDCTRQTIIKFFAQRPVAKHLFQAICNELHLEWGEIAELEQEEEQSSRKLGMNTERENVCEIALEDYSNTQALTSSVSVVEKQNANCNEEKLVITFTGDIETLLKNSNYQAGVLAFMQAVSKDASLKIEKIEKGSIKITFSGSPEGLKKLEVLIKSGNLTEVSGMPVEDVQLLTGVTTEEEQDKFCLIQEIIAHGANGRNLCDADLSGANLSGSDLSNADLSCADLSSTDLRDANLRGADLNCADLSGSDLRGANLRGAYLHDTVIDSATRISDKWRLVWEIVNQASEDRDLSGVDLSEANLSNTNLRKANLRMTNLRSAKLSYAHLSGAILSHAILLCTDLSKANLRSTNLSNANLNGANLSGADLSGANLNDAKLMSDADLSGSNLSHANLSDADLSGSNLSHANLSNADLSRANLSNTDLSGADLRRANLSKANLSGTQVEKAQFGQNSGLEEHQKIDLEKRGAKFEEPPLVSSGRST